ncbi:creatininase family protein [Jannaschia sp. R86511]|uniref:creatininase family protein n=1 Tax=Jannaschia sp. R86511 TaxID=3093853 RepID=UPI0036D3005F
MITTATSHEVRDASPNIAVLPVGSFEQHGGHLPLATDTLVAAAVATAIADAYGLFLLPPVTIGCSHEHEDFPGTVSIRATTLAAVVDDVLDSLARQGITRTVIVNGHGGNYVLSNVVQQVNRGPRHVALYPEKAEWAEARTAAGCDTDHSTDMHAGELETSLLLHLNHTLVREGWQRADHFAPDRRLLLTQGMRALTTAGVVGKPSAATAAKGAAALASLTKIFADRLHSIGG